MRYAMTNLSVFDWSTSFTAASVGIRAVIRAAKSMNPVLFGVYKNRINLLLHSSVFSVIMKSHCCKYNLKNFTLQIYISQNSTRVESQYKVCHCLILLTWLSLWTSSWEVAEELLEYLEPAVVIHGWTVAYAVHYSMYIPHSWTTLFPMLWLPWKSASRTTLLAQPQTHYKA